MSQHEDAVSLKDMLAHAREAHGLLAVESLSSFCDNRVLQLALTRLIEIVGEAAHRVSEPTQQAHPEIPWPRVIGMRNRLVHGYDAVDYDLLWDTVVIDLPPLIAALERIVDL